MAVEAIAEAANVNTKPWFTPDESSPEEAETGDSVLDKIRRTLGGLFSKTDDENCLSFCSSWPSLFVVCSAGTA